MTIADDPDDCIDPATEAVLQHIAMLQAREQELAQMRIGAEEQMLRRVGVDHQNGAITDDQLFTIRERYGALKTPGRSKLWDAHVSIPWLRLGQASRWRPNSPRGTWAGEWPLGASAQVPIRGKSVVYVLFDSDNEPCYVGSTQAFRNRLKWHAKDGKDFTYWWAYPCRDREHAYEVEDRVLKEFKPRLNRKASR